MPSLALSDSFEYLCYGSTATRNIVILTVWGSTLDVRILTSKVDPRAVRVNPYNAEFVLFKPWRPKGYLQFAIVINACPK